MSTLLSTEPSARAVTLDHGGIAFGLDIKTDFLFPGLERVSPDLDRPRVRLTQRHRSEIAAVWPSDTQLLLLQRRADGRVIWRIEAHPESGYRIDALGWGSYLIAPDGSWVWCAPVKAPAWRWQRFLTSQVLPWVAVVHGYEVFHASAVTRQSRTVGFTGPSGVGKSSIATALRMRGWELVADDVIVAEVSSDGRIVVHPGIGLANLDRQPAATFVPGGVESIGRVLGERNGEARLQVPVTSSPGPLTGLYFIRRTLSDPDRVIETLDPPDPSLILSATFNLVIRTPERLTRHLDVCARLADSVAVHRVMIPPPLGPADVARMVDENEFPPRPDDP